MVLYGLVGSARSKARKHDEFVGMSAHRLLRHDAIGETRIAALDEADRVIGLYHERWAEREMRLHWGQVQLGNIAKLSPGDGGAFIRLESGQEGFLSRRDMTGLVEGAHGLWRVVAEARDEKLPRLAKIEDSAETRALLEATPLQHWQDSLPGGAKCAFETSPDATQIIAEAFDDALNPVAPLIGGGRLQITPTPALVAIDVDTVGRRDKGRASARARTVGLAAVEALAREAAIRGLGGALVLDCIAPLSRRDGPELKKHFLETFRGMSTRRAECLPPSPFGLMEAVLAWRTQPLYEAYFEIGEQGTIAMTATPMAALLDGLRQIERAAMANPADRLQLALPGAAFRAFANHRKMYEHGLIERFGARIETVQSPREKIEVSSL